MRQLLLLRHAHAENAAPGAADFDRPLSPRGRAEALDAARCLQVAGIGCDAIMVSPAARTRQTAQILIEELGSTAAVRYVEVLYLADADALLRFLEGADAGLHTLLLVAHNPGISELATRLSDAGSSIELRTSGLCQLRFDAAGDWSGLGERRADRTRILR